MQYTFKFLLTGNRVEYWSFTAIEFANAAEAAFAWSRMAFSDGELIDFEWEA